MERKEESNRSFLADTGMEETLKTSKKDCRRVYTPFLQSGMQQSLILFELSQKKPNYLPGLG